MDRVGSWSALLFLFICACGEDSDPDDLCEQLSCDSCELEDANDDRPAIATPVNAGSTAEGELCPDDRDWFRVDLGAGDELSLELQTDSPVWVEIRDQEAGPAVRSGVLASGDESVFTFALEDGPLFVGIFGSGSASVRYQVRLNTNEETLFVSPDGDDADRGTFSAPLKTVAQALSVLGPGDTLAWLPGRYEAADYDDVQIDCDNGAPNGEAGAPIRMVAARERTAHHLGELKLDNCAHWVLDGLHVETADDPTTSSQRTLRVERCEHIVVRRSLVTHANRFNNAHVLAVLSSSDVLVEENEVYHYHRAGIFLYQSDRVVVRRNYTNSRGYRRLVAGDPLHPSGTASEDGYASGYEDRGDQGVDLWNSTGDVIVENHLDEGSGVGFSMGSTTGPNQVISSIALNTTFGFRFNGAEEGPNTMASVENSVSIGASGSGFSFLSSQGLSVSSSSAFDTTGVGFRFQMLDGSGLGDVNITDSLAVNNEQGFQIEDQSSYRVENSLSFNNSTEDSFSGEGMVVDAIAIDPRLAECRIFPPADSPLSDPEMAELGARIVFRSQDGEETEVPLWNPQSGRFPCGLVVEGVNDDPATSCIGAHLRVPIGVGDCRVPQAPMR